MTSFDTLFGENWYEVNDLTKIILRGCLKPLNRESDCKTAAALQDNTLGEVNCHTAVGNCAHESRAHNAHFCTPLLTLCVCRNARCKDDRYFEWIASLPACENEIDIDTQMENLTAMLKNLSEMSGDYSNMLFAILKRLDTINEYVRKRL